MKRRWKIALLLMGLFALVALFVFRGAGGAERAAQELRQQLSKQGFKVDLEEFDFSATEDERKRAAALLAADILGARIGNVDSQTHQLLSENPAPMQVIGSNTALVVWKEETLDSNIAPDGWPLLREILEERRTELDAAAHAALAGDISFDLNATHGFGLLLPHLPSLKNLTRLFATRALVEMRDGNREQAWTNLLVATHIATAYKPGALEICHLVRYTCAAIAHQCAWQLLQAEGWSDDQLQALQREWARAEFLSGLPGTVAFTRAAVVAQLEQERLQAPTMRFRWQELVRSPRSLPDSLKQWWGSAQFRRYGSYELETALLQHYADQEKNWRTALESPTWKQMRQRPGVNAEPYVSNKTYPSPTLMQLNLRQMAMGFQSGRSGTMARAARAEGNRRVVMVAVALERWRKKHGSYPEQLSQLAPEFLPDVPNDFMDGQPLRYRVPGGDRFVLYSVDIDCVDHGGALAQVERWGGVMGEGIGMGESKRENDLVWPMAASDTEAQKDREERWEQQRIAMEEADAGQADWRWERTARRQARIDEILARGQKGPTNEPTVDGRPISEVLRNASYLGTTNLSISDLLTLRQVITGEEPERIIFELPIHYPTLTNLGELHLYVDPWIGEDSDDGCTAVFSEVLPATNGNCLLVWEAGFDAPGKHLLQAGVMLNHQYNFEGADGPYLPFVSSNVCQFNETSTEFDPRFGPTIRGKLVESNAVYSVEFTCHTENHRRTLTGSTSNGVFTVYWDLTLEDGKRCTSPEIDTVFHFTFPESGRSFTQKGP